jgi:hypothetical protein
MHLKEIVQHEEDGGTLVKARESIGETFVVAAQAAKACLPTEGAFHHPAFWQQHKAPAPPGTASPPSCCSLSCFFQSDTYQG